MASGGARARSGPAPDPNALRRERDEGEWTILPAEGRSGDAPDWPLTGGGPREGDLWARLWKKPQALMWERYGQELEVALYVRNLALAEQSDAPVNLGTLVRQMSDSLGLTTPGMRANRWRIQSSNPAEQTSSQTGAATVSARDRFKVVRSDGDA